MPPRSCSRRESTNFHLSYTFLHLWMKKHHTIAESMAQQKENNILDGFTQCTQMTIVFQPTSQGTNHWASPTSRNVTKMLIMANLPLLNKSTSHDPPVMLVVPNLDWSPCGCKQVSGVGATTLSRHNQDLLVSW